MRFQFIFDEVSVALRRNAAMAISVVLVTLVSLFLLGMGFLAQRQVEVMKTYWYDRVQVSIFLCGEDSTAASCASGAASDAQKDEIRADLASPQLAPYVDRVYFEDKPEAFAHFKEQLGDSVLSDNVTVDQMPESFRVKLKNPEQYEVVAQVFADRPGVESVEDQNQILDRLFALLNRLKYYSWCLAAVTLICSVLLVATTIRLTAFSRRRETGIMRLVGASNLFIQLPFILESMIAAAVCSVLLVSTTIRLTAFTRRRETGIMRLVGASNLFIQLPFVLESMIAAAVGAVLASAGLVAVTQFEIQGRLSNSLRFVNYVTTSDALMITPWLFLIGLGIAGVSSFLALSRYLKV